jgi:hypothetical protein
MADNVAITAGTGTTIATDDSGTEHYQEVKIMAGADGTFTGDVAGRTVDGGTGAALFTDVRPKAVRLSVTPTISTGIYAAKDAIGGLMTFSNAVRASGGSGVVMAVQVTDKDQELRAMDLFLFDRSITATTDNAIFAPSDTEMTQCVGVIPIGAYADTSTNAVAYANNVGLAFVANGTDLFGQLVARDTPTFTATSDIVVTLTIYQD